MNKKIIILSFFLIILIILIGLVSFKLIHKYQTYKEHKSYFNLPESKQDIQPWMSLYFIENKFNLNLDKEFNKNISFFDKRLTLEDYCKKNNLNQKEIIINLNQKIKRNINK